MPWVLRNLGNWFTFLPLIHLGQSGSFLVPWGTSAHMLTGIIFFWRIPERLQESLYVLMPHKHGFSDLCVYSVAYVRPLPWCVATQGNSHWMTCCFCECPSLPWSGHFVWQNHPLSTESWVVLWSSEWFQLHRSSIERRHAHSIWLWDSWLILLPSFSNLRFLSEWIFTACWGLCA